MQFLRRLSANPAVAFYSLEGDDEPIPLDRYVVSTAGSRAVCNRSEVLGCEYTDALNQAVTAALGAAPFREAFLTRPEPPVCVLNFLRGGLNFDLRGALHGAYGLNTHASAFMSSQRQLAGDRWSVAEDGYRKLAVPDGALLLIGDVVATGVTLAHGLEGLLEELVARGRSLSGLVFFTLGCARVEQILTDFDQQLRRGSSDYQGTRVIYLEGRFELAGEGTPLQIKVDDTDLLRRGALLAPEFEASQLEALAFPLERCAIYDAGSRAFEPDGYAEDVSDYWRQVAALAGGGTSLRELLLERWPEGGPSSIEDYLDSRKARWRGVDEAELEAQWRRQQARWAQLEGSAGGTEALGEVSRERLAALSGALR